MILGLDVSTSVIGVCLYDKEGLVKLDNIDLRKIKCFFQKCDLVNVYFTDLLIKFPDVSEVFIEDILQSFSRGMSSAKTITQLARFNGIVSFIVNKTFGIVPVYLNVNTARKLLDIKIDKNSNIEKKEQVFLWVDDHLSGYNWPTKTLKSGPRKGETIRSSVCYDMADAYVIALAGYTQQT